MARRCKKGWLGGVQGGGAWRCTLTRKGQSGYRGGQEEDKKGVEGYKRGVLEGDAGDKRDLLVM